MDSLTSLVIVDREVSPPSTAFTEGYKSFSALLEIAYKCIGKGNVLSGSRTEKQKSFV